MPTAPHFTTRRKVLGGLATLPAWRHARAADGDLELSVAGFHGPFQKAFQAIVINSFERAMPGVRVTYRPIINSAQLLAALRLEREVPQIDVAIADVSVAILAKQEGLTSILREEEIPTLRDIPDWGRFDAMNGVAFSRDNLSLIYDSRVLTRPPESWRELGRPDLTDQIAMPVEDTRGVVLLPLLTRMAGGDYRQNIEPGLTLMRQFAPYVATWNAQPDIYTLTLAQTIALGVGWNGRGQMLARDNPDTLRAVVPSEGSVAQINTLNLTAPPQRTRLAQAFIEHALSPDVQTAFANVAFYGPVNRQVVLSDETSEAIFGRPETARRELHLDWGFVSQHYNSWIRRIQREVISG
ncbi:spermidine/putrescine-binding periplasmic protein [Gluconobacter frateurii NBRC 103465]|nr:spermidine/putrescine-binding periplasmic protein [Gluconobacter frateurii NBRC 103465]